ncbi:MAG TPA: hypothetical protein VEW69_01120 [Alphaproteobacteria bacterium]|nr:hypothetical protein [Alphaproteobacteria bacterium]
MTLVETMVAAVIMIVVVVGLIPVFIMGLTTTEDQGNVATRTTEYAQDKMEALINLSFTDPALGGALAASTTVGSLPPAAPVATYVDYIDANGNTLAGAAGAYYQRQWSVTTDATATLKTITIVVVSLPPTGARGFPLTTTLVSIKSSGL